MRHLLTLTLTASLLTGTALAQDAGSNAAASPADASTATLPQANSVWYTDAQVRIQEMLARQPNTNRAKNVILFVSDGNGVGTNFAVRVFDGQSKGMLGEENVLPYEAFPNTALVKTYNINAQTPDSAPTAGAMNTGIKQRFNTINLSEDGRHDQCASEEGNKLTTFAEMATEAGKSVGVVSTARITHATPAGVYAKTASRDWEASAPEGCTDIATQLVEQMKAGVVDIALGGGGGMFFSEGADTEGAYAGKREDGKNLVEEATSAGASYAYNAETLKAADMSGDKPVLGLFGSSHMSYEVDRPDSEPSLTDISLAALDYLKNNDQGFYLEIESGRVDHANHDGNAYRTLTDGQEFARAVAAVDAATDDEDTLIIVTADHEHAISFNGYCGRGNPILGLCHDVDPNGIKHSDTPLLADDGKPYTVIGYLNGPGSVLTPMETAETVPPTDQTADAVEASVTGDAAPETENFSGSRPDVTEEEATDMDYIQQALIPLSSETHSGEDVMVFAKGPWAHLFDGVIEQNYIFHVMNHAALEAADAAQ
ncbi:alkaline phosphatase [Fulvimarina sp. 2208YS6-2-32]|uniref:Alkaline phosphatase n=1 Tax=Fulvimarina uroteuthidis TaxID=3098149 RepID=A0ABU5I2M7_9HYPH|nr:alkaline phosphatase [Fulvimarina sp. 2208YS6-2-32]MDY8109074.1 alkaline phosphatase [Fulvimarina sp. 2208YS6-2-32]